MTGAATPRVGDRSRPGERWGIALLLGLLGLAAGMAADMVARMQVAASRSAVDARLVDRVRRLAFRSEPDLFIRSRMLALLTSVRRRPAVRLAPLHRYLQRRWGLETTIFRFDGRGNLQQALPADAPNRWLIERLYRGLILPPGEEQLASQKQLDGRLRFAYGAGASLVAIRNHRRMVLGLERSDGPIRFTWDAGSGWGLIVIASRLPDAAAIGRMVLTPPHSVARPRAGPGGVGLAAEAEASRFSWTARLGIRPPGQPFQCGQSGATDPLAASAFAQLAHGAWRVGSASGWRWAFLELGNGRVVYAREPAWPSDETGATTTAAGLGWGGVAALIAFGLAGWAFPTARMGLRPLVVSMFALAALIPVVGLIAGSVGMVSVYRQVLAVRAMAFQTEALENLEHGFEAFISSASHRLAAETAVPALQRADGDVTAVVSTLLRRGLCDRLELRDAGGRVLFTSDPAQSAHRELLVRPFSRAGIEMHEPTRLDEAPYRADPVLDRLMRAVDMGFPSLLRWMGRIRRVTLGAMVFYFYFRVFPPGGGRVAYLEAQWEPPNAVGQYLVSQRLRRLEHEGVLLRLFAYAPESCRWRWAPPRALRRRLTAQALAAWIEGSSLVAQLPTDEGRGSGGLLACRPSPDLAGHCLVGWLPDERIAERSRWFGSQLAVGAVGFLVWLLSLGSLVSKHLLQPLSGFAAGIAALRERRFTFRLAVGDRDEFGRLAAAFDAMMDEARDLEMARHVQEGLVPREFPAVPGFSCHGRLTTAADLGGDCLDAVALPDGRFGFLIGDVSGHGVASALMMAFARAVTFHWSRSESPSAASLATELDRLLRERSDRRVFMSVMIGVLAPAGRRLELVVCGHPWPLLVAADGSTRWIGGPCLPLGIGRTYRPPITWAVEFAPGDALLGYTDGLIEGVSPAGDVAGFDRLETWAVGGPRHDAAAWLTDLVARQAEWCRSVATDDITLLAIVASDGKRDVRSVAAPVESRPGPRPR